MEKYSVLMSVYAKEKSEYLQKSMDSMFSQTVPTDDFVLVCDGPLTKELDFIIDQMKQKYPKILHVVKLKENVGLGNALKEGIGHCKNELIARMDSDDISYPNRCERQLLEFKKNAKLDIVSGTIEEFQISPKKITGKRVLPITYKDILQFSKKRNPFNHVAVMYRKSSVIKAGNYSEEYHLFEDYFLWIKMLMNGCKAKNIDASLVLVRMPLHAYRRRGGKIYAKDMLRFHSWMYKIGWINWMDFFTGAIPHAIICILPIRMRKRIYEKVRG